MKHKKLFTVLTAILSLILAIIIFLMIWFWGDTYNGGTKSEGFSDFRTEMVIPGLKDGATPQGITAFKPTADIVKTDDGENETVIPQQNFFFISAYFSGKPSRIYVVGEISGEIGYVTLKNVDGSDYTGHCGGIATNGITLWVSSDSTVYVAKAGTSASEYVANNIIKLAAEKGCIQFTASFNANCNASFLYYYQGTTTVNNSSNKLYVGEFYRAGNYETDKQHHLTTNNGYENTAFAYEYSIAPNTSAEYKYGLATISGAQYEDGSSVPKIDKIFSITGEIQGFARTANGIVLSQSYGLKNSEIYYYKFDWNTTSANSYASYKTIANKDFKYDGVKTTNGAQYYASSLNVYFLDDDLLINDYSIPSMSEGLCTVGDRVYVLFESGAKKYKYFVRQSLKNVYSIIPRKSDKF